MRGGGCMYVCKECVGACVKLMNINKSIRINQNIPNRPRLCISKYVITQNSKFSTWGFREHRESRKHLFQGIKRTKTKYLSGYQRQSWRTGKH